MEIFIRKADEEDFSYVRRLMIESSIYNVPVNRDIPNRAVKATVRSTADQVLDRARQSDDFVVLVAEDRDSGERMGYLLLDLNHTEPSTGERQGYIFDLGVEERFWGTQAGPMLTRKAAALSGQAGHRYVTAEITAANRRSYLKSLRMGFVVERYKIAMACTPEGPTKMPGRPAKERAHDHSRSKRRETEKDPD